MITSQDIRVDNVVLYYFEEDNKWMPCKMDWRDIRECTADNKTFNDWYKLFELDVKVLDCFFKKDRFGIFNIYSHYHIIIRNEKIILRGLGASILEIKSLHQLQNLCWDLMQKELDTTKLFEVYG